MVQYSSVFETANTAFDHLQWYPQWTPYPPTHFQLVSFPSCEVFHWEIKNWRTCNNDCQHYTGHHFTVSLSTCLFPCCQVLHWEIQGLEVMLQWQTICVAGSTASRCSLISTAWNACISGSVTVVHALCIILTGHCKMCCYYCCWRCWLKQTIKKFLLFGCHFSV